MVQCASSTGAQGAILFTTKKTKLDFTDANQLLAMKMWR